MARHAASGLKGHEHGAEPDPGKKSLHETVSLGKGVDRVDNFAVQETEVSGVGRDDHRAACFHEMIVHALETAPEPGFRTVALHACDDLVALTPALQKHRDESRWMLSIRVHQNHGVTHSHFKACR